MSTVAATRTPSFRKELFACPNCHKPLASQSGLSCQSCARSFEIVDGIPCFSSPDAFYDEYANEHCPFAASPAGMKGFVLRFLPFWSWREWKFWSSAIPSCGRLLDFGCGRGREIFLSRAKETVGYDGSLTFLRDCSRRYSDVALGQLPRLPFRSGHFDVVVSSHTIGHVGFEQKDELVSEIARVLRPGGVTAHIIETDSEHPAVRAAKRRPDAYRKQFLEQHGHIGLEPAEQVIERFARHGFEMRMCRLVDAIIPSVLNFRRTFAIPELTSLPELAWSRRLSKWSASSPIANALYEVGFGAFHRSVEQWFGKPQNAQFILVSFVKTSLRSAKAPGVLE